MGRLRMILPPDPPIDSMTRFAVQKPGTNEYIGIPRDLYEEFRSQFVAIDWVKCDQNIVWIYGTYRKVTDKAHG